jgi:hypothetical protein
MKVQTLIANIGGLSKGLFFGLYIISFYFSRVKLNKIILNTIFDFEVEPSTAKPTVEPGQSSTMKNIIAKSDNVFTYNMNNNNTINKSSIRPRGSPNRKPKELNLPFCETLKKPCCKQFVSRKTKIKYNLYDQAHSVLEGYMDISHIINKLEEYDKLKLAILNDEQLAMFQFIAKDVYSVEDRLKQQSYLRQLKFAANDKERSKKLIQNFKMKIEKRQKDVSALDKKLYEMLDGDIKSSI